MGRPGLTQAGEATGFVAVPLAGAGRRVLLAVDDDATFAAQIEALVEEMGFDCVVAGTGEQAWSPNWSCPTAAASSCSNGWLNSRRTARRRGH